MTPDQIKSNIKSWEDTLAFIDGFHEEKFREWRQLAMRFMEDGMGRNYNQYFLSGSSHQNLLFSTAEKRRIHLEPNITVVIRPANAIRLIYTPKIPTPKGDEELEYELNFHDALPTFQRFLNHLWKMTQTEPLPLEMRSFDSNSKAPILTENDRITKD